MKNIRRSFLRIHINQRTIFKGFEISIQHKHPSNINVAPDAVDTLKSMTPPVHSPEPSIPRLQTCFK